MNKQEQIQYSNNQRWLAKHGDDILTEHNKAVGSVVSQIDLYASAEGVHAQITLGNGLTLDFLVPGVVHETVISEFDYIPEAWRKDGT